MKFDELCIFSMCSDASKQCMYSNKPFKKQIVFTAFTNTDYVVYLQKTLHILFPFVVHPMYNIVCCSEHICCGVVCEILLIPSLNIIIVLRLTGERPNGCIAAAGIHLLCVQKMLFVTVRKTKNVSVNISRIHFYSPPPM